MSRRDVVVVGASAGGVRALQDVASRLPADFPAAVLVVLHTAPTARSALAAILSRSGPLPVAQAAEGDALLPGRILVAPPDRHLVVDGDRVLLSRGPRENGHRPSVDALFRSAARELGPRVVAVVLSGTLDDGAAGMVAVHQQGGIGVVEDPATAAYPGMPSAAMAADQLARVVPLERVAAVLEELVGVPVDERAAHPTELLRVEVDIAADAQHSTSPDEQVGVPAGFACPDCNGPLSEIHEGRLHRFRCRVGHAWSPASLAAQQGVAVEGALWLALRTLEERVALSERMARNAADRGHAVTADKFTEQASEARSSALVIRGLIAGTATVALDVTDDLLTEDAPRSA
ncbi:chemotaxis protein CheB [Cellulomonas shaoxiangyii]|uniref:protein-glutamate methylesterase n=1 Tax=Cellulomonas shaoxiangyii TaxID=2566013 RepID=A0A4P7SJP1_9CELL|nr:chemotaxis protein CheB [Cellulomonas shaoxiangyii]QCB93707.1 chemotaxis protein CheB [Cellulomonas shaoxiangyii]TGY86188.1 chemotaxis protein CheB [Cellulomonas shaoxiangyii]